MVLKKIFWGLLPVIIALPGCDQISKPLNSVQVNSSLPNTPPTYRDSSAATYATTYKVLLEDIMGHFCGNCPPASQEADSLAQFNSQVLMMEDHSGFFAEIPPQFPAPSGLPAGAFTEDLTSVAGNYWQNNLYNFVLWPQGLINRINWTKTAPSSMGINPSNWVSTINSLIAANPHPSVTINIHDSCWVPQRILGVQITLNVIFPLSDSNYMMQALIVEDSCFGWQVDDYTTPSDIPLFNHRYVLRGAFGNNTGGLPWGSQIPTSITANGGKWTTYLTYDFTNGENGKAKNWNMEHCHIIAFVANQGNYRIIQAEEIRVE